MKKECIPTKKGKYREEGERESRGSLGVLIVEDIASRQPSPSRLGIDSSKLENKEIKDT